MRRKVIDALFEIPNNFVTFQKFSQALDSQTV